MSLVFRRPRKLRFDFSRLKDFFHLTDELLSRTTPISPESLFVSLDSIDVLRWRLYFFSFVLFIETSLPFM